MLGCHGFPIVIDLIHELILFEMLFVQSSDLETSLLVGQFKDDKCSHISIA